MKMEERLRELQGLSKEELIRIITQREFNLSSVDSDLKPDDAKAPQRAKLKQARDNERNYFPWAKTTLRKICLRLLYLGHSYSCGFAS